MTQTAARRVRAGERGLRNGDVGGYDSRGWSALRALGCRGGRGGRTLYISHIEDVAEAVDGTYERRSERMRVGLIDLGGRTGAVRKIMTLPRVRA